MYSLSLSPTLFVSLSPSFPPPLSIHIFNLLRFESKYEVLFLHIPGVCPGRNHSSAEKFQGDRCYYTTHAWCYVRIMWVKDPVKVKQWVLMFKLISLAKFISLASNPSCSQSLRNYYLLNFHEESKSIDKVLQFLFV
jgi:hypothetical protein